MAFLNNEAAPHKARNQKYLGLDPTGITKGPDLINNEALSALSTTLVETDLIKLNASNAVEVPNGLTIPTGKTLAVTDADTLTIGGKIVPQTFFIPFNIPAGAAAADYDGSIPIPVAAKLVSVTERHQTAGSDGSAVTLMVKKVPSGTAKAAGTDCLAAGISLKATADTNQSPSLHATAANYTFAAGDAVGLVLTGTPTSVDGVTLTAQFQRV